MMSKLISFELDVDISTFLSLFWLDNGDFINSFLSEELRYAIYHFIFLIITNNNNNNNNNNNITIILVILISILVNGVI